MTQSEVEKYRLAVEEFLAKMSFRDVFIEVEKTTKTIKDLGPKEVFVIRLEYQDPQILIGQNGQTLLEIQRLLKIIFNKKFAPDIYLELDINSYRSKKIDYLKRLAQDCADEVVRNKEEKSLTPMLPHERKIIHSELSKRNDIITQSHSNGNQRYITVSPR